MTFNEIFGVTYATFCGVQLGESFVKKPPNIGAGSWLEFWEEKFSDQHFTVTSEEFEELQTENESIEDENDDLREEVARLEKIVDEQDEKIAKLKEDCDRMDYEMGRP